MLGFIFTPKEFSVVFVAALVQEVAGSIKGVWQKPKIILFARFIKIEGSP